MENKITITREWAMPNKRTFEIPPIRMLIDKHIPIWGFYPNQVLDPFPFDYKEDATKFLSRIKDESYEFVLFDPPYSPRQLKECYDNKGEYDTKSSTWSKWKDLVSKKLKVGGIIISFGWSSQGMGKERGFEIIEILLVAHGGMHNDTICVVEEKIQSKFSSLNNESR